MYCPRCGSPNPDATKFCRQCGLALTQLTGYVASGGTAQLPQPQSTLPSPSNPTSLVAKATDGLTPKQKMILTILLLVFSPAIFGTLGGVTGLESLGGGLAGISAVLMPIGIIFTVMRYKAQKRRLEQAQAQMMMQQPLYPPMQQAMPPAAPYGLPQPMQPPIQQPVAPPQHYHQPVYQPPQVTSPPPTNPLKGPGSVTEDDTRRLQ